MVGTRRLSDLAESMMSRLDLPEGPLVAGLSGGADSSAMAWLVARAGREVRGFSAPPLDFPPETQEGTFWLYRIEWSSPSGLLRCY